MNCEKVRNVLDDFLNGKMSGDVSRAVRLHLAFCASCASRLNASERIEILPVLDETIEPSEDFAANFRARLNRREGTIVGAPERENRGAARIFWRRPWGLVAVGALAALLAAGIFVRHSGDGSVLPENSGDLAIAQNLSLLEDLPVVSNLDLLENFDTIEKVAPALEGLNRQRSIE